MRRLRELTYEIRGYYSDMARVDMSLMKEKIKMTHYAYESPQKLLLLDGRRSSNVTHKNEQDDNPYLMTPLASFSVNLPFLSIRSKSSPPTASSKDR